MAITSSSFIDLTYFNLMSGLSISAGSVEDFRFQNLANAVVKFMENFCNRLLKSRGFNYVVPDPNDVNYPYNPKYAIFDPPKGDTFYFPLFPVNTIVTLLVSDNVITPATDYSGTDGYILYPDKGCLVYYDGFDFGYKQNVKIKWNGGITSGTDNYSELQYLQYLFVKFIYDEDPINDGITSETLSNYSYKTGNVKDIAEYLGIPMFVFNRLQLYRRYYIA